MTTAALAPFERDMIKYVISWAPYGDPPEDDCLPRFGKSFAHVQIRVRELVIIGLQQHIKPNDRLLLVRAAILLGIPMQVLTLRPTRRDDRCGEPARIPAPPVRERSPRFKTTSTRYHANPPKLNPQ
jgi:hypothetical protein